MQSDFGERATCGVRDVSAVFVRVQSTLSMKPCSICAAIGGEKIVRDPSYEIPSFTFGRELTDPWPPPQITLLCVGPARLTAPRRSRRGERSGT